MALIALLHRAEFAGAPQLEAPQPEGRCQSRSDDPRSAGDPDLAASAILDKDQLPPAGLGLVFANFPNQRTGIKTDCNFRAAALSK
jgi:hypothetical protein